MSEACLSAWSWAATRVVVALCVFTLLASAWAVTPGAVLATGLGDQISSGRRSQAYYESAMLAQDAAIGSIKRQATETRRALREAKRAITQSKHALRIARVVVQQRSGRLAELEALHANTPIEQVPAGYPDRLRSVRRELKQAQSRRASIGQHLRTSVRNRHARQYRLGALKRAVQGAVARRESAEGGLGAYIVQLTRLASQRAEIQSEARLSSSGSGFTWPSVGRIAQTYGCTGFHLNPSRGSCRHFHDGLDIVAGYGSRISTAADGVVAYAGWNPWDEGGRAWLMVVSHPDGYVTRYGHLLPASIARVGEFVRQGQAIGRMGNTGRSTGTHLHFELLHGDSTVSPWAYLPQGMVTIMEPKDSDKRGHHVAKRTGAQTTRDGGSRKNGAGRARTADRWGRADGDGKKYRGGAHKSGKAGDRGASPVTDAQATAASSGTAIRAAALAPFAEGVIDTDAVVCRSRLAPSEADASELNSLDPAAADVQGSSSRRADPDDPCATLDMARSTDTRAVRTAADPPAGGRAADSVTAAADRDAGVARPYRGSSPVPA